ncbi:hypothetical protein GCM10018785_52700 [Streptomyces longispororuber]|uniref:Uncharacterized protein n=1 Tax=Streptomyces longispororuber TaxID=68230 RepID=A0A918ZYP6_9ACTN|nr:hypothetical protein GCM10018785_52700 [Streptomyces longispororuber]
MTGRPFRPDGGVQITQAVTGAPYEAPGPKGPGRRGSPPGADDARVPCDARRTCPMRRTAHVSHATHGARVPCDALRPN